MNHDHQAIEAAKKNVKRIRRAGISAEILGLILILLGAASVWLPGAKYNILIRFAIIVLLGIYFFLSGVYIKDGWGRRVKIALLTNGILAIPLCVLIIPIYVCIQSINNYSRFKDLPDNVRGLYSKPKPFKLRNLDIILLVIVILIATASIGIKLPSLYKKSSTSTSQTANDQPVIVTESKYGFKIKFPQTPVATDFSKNESGHAITYTTYNSHSKNGTQDFNVYAYSWPAKYYNFDKLSKAQMSKTIHSALTAIIKERKGTVINSIPSTYLGHASEDAQFTSPTLGDPVMGYIRVFYIGNTEYAVIVIAADQSDFNNFANTFQSTTN